MRHRLILAISCLLLALSLAEPSLAHAVAQGDKGYIQGISGVHLVPFIYLGAKHMVTGYDHILFLVAVIFFLYGFRQIATYVSLFAVGHTVTLLTGVWFQVGINAYVIDAIIGFSVVYKALDNLGAWRIWFGVQPSTKLATGLFGLLHGLGLATKILEYEIAAQGLWLNLIAFNIGVELGQIIALSLILMIMTQWRAMPAFDRQAYGANLVLMTAGFALMFFQLAGLVWA